MAILDTEYIKNKTEDIFKNSDVSFAGLFGSYAKGEAREDSDVDILVQFNSTKSLLDLVELENSVKDVLNKDVDLITKGFLSPYFRDAVLKDVFVLYEKR